MKKQGVICEDMKNKFPFEKNKKNKYTFVLSRGAFVCVFLFAASAMFSQKAHAAITIPLTVQEALPAGVTGMDRTNEPVTVGIPLAQDSGITDANQLGLSGTSAGQLRVTGRWPNGNIKWVLADFQASVSAGQTNTNASLTNGSGNFGGSDLATDNGLTISINTGAAQFTIKKANFNVFDSIVVGGQALVNGGNSGGVRGKDINGSDFSSINDASSTAVIEENGPVRTVVKATGSLKDAGGNWLLDYTLRIHFFKNKSYVKTFATIANANINHKINAPFNSFEVVVPMNITGAKTAIFSRTSDTVSANLASGTSAYLFQGWNTKYDVQEQGACDNWHPPVAGNPCTSDSSQYASASRGLTIKNDTATLNPAGDVSQYSQGYAEFKDGSGKGITTAYRWMPAYWPAGFEFNDNGEASIELYSKHQSGVSLKMHFQTHDTRELSWDFHTAAVDNGGAMQRLQYPLIASAQFSQYQNSKGIYNQDEFVTPAQQSQFFGDVGAGNLAPSLNNPAFTRVYRAWGWSANSGDNQMDADLNKLMNFLRTGNAGWYLSGEQQAKFKNDSGVARSDNFTNTYTDTPTDPAPSVGLTNSWSMDRDMEHANMKVLPLYYFMTGDEGIKDGVIDYGQQSQAEEEQSKFPLPDTAGNYSSQGTPYFRAYSRRFKNFAVVYQFTCDVGSCNNWYKDIINQAMTKLLDTVEVPNVSIGRDLSRGYIWRDITLGHKAHGLFHSQIHYEAMWEVYQTMLNTGWNYPRLLDFQDYLLGLSQWYFDEWYADSGDANAQSFQNDFGFDADYPYDTAQTDLAYWLVPTEAGRAARIGYFLTGDATMLTKGNKLVVGSTVHATANSASELQEQSLMWLHFNQSTAPKWSYVNSVNVVDNGGGSYTLSWTVPEGASQYQIKHSDKPIVDWLGFDRFARTYQYDPASHTPFFAASNICNNPTPDAAGDVQSVTLTGMGNNQYFSVKALSSSSDTTPPAAPSGLSVM